MREIAFRSGKTVDNSPPKTRKVRRKRVKRSHVSAPKIAQGVPEKRELFFTRCDRQRCATEGEFRGELFRVQDRRSGSHGSVQERPEDRVATRERSVTLSPRFGRSEYLPPRRQHRVMRRFARNSGKKKGLVRRLASRRFGKSDSEREKKKRWRYESVRIAYGSAGGVRGVFFPENPETGCRCDDCRVFAARSGAFGVVVQIPRVGARVHRNRGRESVFGVQKTGEPA